MDKAHRTLILEFLERHQVVALATLREDGWPQATAVGYVNEGLTLFVATGADAQKVRNIRRDGRVSAAINRELADWSGLQGLSMAAHAEVLSSRSEIQHAARLVKKKFQTLAEFSDPEHDRGWAMLKIVPQVISLIDYTKGFGHTVLITL